MRNAMLINYVCIAVSFPGVPCFYLSPYLSKWKVFTTRCTPELRLICGEDPYNWYKKNDGWLILHSSSIDLSLSTQRTTEASLKECKRSLSITNEEVKREISRVLRRQTKVIYFLMTLNTSATKKHENGWAIMLTCSWKWMRISSCVKTDGNIY